MKTKVCIGCHKTKPVSEFYKSPHGDGYRARCGSCHWNSQKKAAREASPDERRRLSEYAKAKARRWDVIHPFSKRARRLNRRALLHGVAGRLSEKEVRAAWELYHCRCWICGANATDTDHYRPTNKTAGGTNTADNIRPICPECNQKRSHRWRGESIAEKEAHLLRELALMLNGGCVT